MAVIDLSPDTILKAKKCGDLFPADADKMKIKYREILRLYHPDVSTDPRATEIARHVNELYDRAIKLLEKDEWEATNIVFLTTGKRTISFRYQVAYPFELGMMYIGSTKVIYVLDKQHQVFYDNALRAIGKLSYRDDKMKKEFARYFPKIYEHFIINDGRLVLVLDKTKDVIYLPDVHKYLGKQIPIKHIVWIISRLSSIACYMYYSNITYNGITLSNCFISPEHHSVVLYGGWWYCMPEGKPLIGTQNEIYNIMPVIVKTAKVGNSLTDLESIKLLGRNLIKGVSDVPIEISRWLNRASSKGAFEEFNKWNQALDAAYGKRKFIELNVSENHLYKER